VYIVPMLRLARAVQQNMSWAAQISSSGWRLSMLHLAWMMAGCIVWVDRMPWGLRLMWPLLVAVEYGKWVLISCALRPGMVAGSLLSLRACISVVARREYRAWCM
jgi:hypothetical protein